ncbi:MAG: hypothetical protein QXT73_01215 [Candidatus Methanomethylicaceae archaeon]
MVWYLANKTKMPTHQRYVEYRRRGLCGICGTKPTVPGYVTCAKCSSKKMIRNREYMRRRRANLDDKLCVSCLVRSRSPNSVLCSECLEYLRTRRKKIREGRCRLCLRKLDALALLKGDDRCAACRARWV